MFVELPHAIGERHGIAVLDPRLPVEDVDLRQAPLEQHRSAPLPGRGAGHRGGTDRARIEHVRGRPRSARGRALDQADPRTLCSRSRTVDRARSPGGWARRRRGQDRTHRCAVLLSSCSRFRVHVADVRSRPWPCHHACFAASRPAGQNSRRRNSADLLWRSCGDSAQ